MTMMLLVMAAVGCTDSSNNSDNTQQSGTTEQTAQADEQSTQTQEQTQEQAQEQTQESSEPVVIASWEGESTKNTETFTVPTDEWKISWDTKPGELGDMNFQIYVYDKNGAMKGVAANVVGANNESTVMRGAGDYYLTINTAQPYKITVETT